MMLLRHSFGIFLRNKVSTSRTNSILFVYSITCTIIIVLLTSRTSLPQNIFLPKPENTTSGVREVVSAQLSSEHWSFNATRDADNYGLSEEQCEIAFKELLRPVDDMIQALKKPIVKDDLVGGRARKEVRVLLWDNALYVINDWADDLVPNRKFATLHAISRAIVAVAATGERFRNVEFIFCFADKSSDDTRPIWAYDRLIGNNKTWLMPDFSFYSWPAHGVGTYPEVRLKIKEVESAQAGFYDKIPQLLWKGTVGFGSKVRQALVKATEGRRWSAVEGIDWKAADIDDRMLSMADHCKYKFLAYTEGLAYSGRLKYLHNCESVIIAHVPTYETHDQHLWRTSGPDQNIVMVEPDFSNLEEKMSFLLTHPSDAARIARNNVETFRDLNLTPAAEGCYWRKLIREWGRNSFNPDFYETINGTKKWRGVPFESFSLTRSMEWDVSHVG